MKISLGAQARAELLRGADRLADTVRATLGPKGRSVAMYQKKNAQGAKLSDRAGSGAPVLITNNGSTVSEAILLPDAKEDLGVRLLRRAAEKVSAEAGGGATTTIVLAQCLMHELFRLESAGADGLALRRGVEKAARAAAEELPKMAIPADSESMLAKAAATACADEALGALAGRACFAVGPEGSVTVDDARTQETTLEIQTGIVLERGYLSSEMTTNEGGTAAELQNPRILLCDGKLDNVQEILPALILCAEDACDLLIICDGLSGDARSTILRTDMDGDIKIVCIEAPLYGDGRRWRMEDLSVQLGAAYFQKALNMDLRNITRADFGTAERVCVTKQRTVLYGASGPREALDARIRELRYLANNEAYEFNRKRYRQRLAQLSSGVAVISVGGHTQTALWERKSRMECAVSAARGAQREGVVPGGGTAFLRLIPPVAACAARLSGDEKLGALAAARALEAPARQIAENAEQDASAILAKLKDLPENMGYNAETGEFEDLLQAGILDPVCTIREAMQASFSAAATIMTVEGSICGKSAEGGAHD